jgi:general secretion pathway protein J
MRPSRAPRRRTLRGHAGITLLEVVVTTAILSMIAIMTYTAFMHTARVRTRLSGRQEQDHLARTALNRIGRDIRSAFLSAHVNTNPLYVSVVTAFYGRHESDGDRLDMTTFTHRRLVRHAHEGDACEVGYRVEARRGAERIHDLLRRESRRIDNDPFRGGTVDVLVPNIDSLTIRYFDPANDTWIDGWDSTEISGQKGRMPGRVRIELVLRDAGGAPRRYMTETSPMIPEMLRFGLPIDYR